MFFVDYIAKTSKMIMKYLDKQEKIENEYANEYT